MPFDGSEISNMVSAPSPRVLAGLPRAWYQRTKSWFSVALLRGLIPAMRTPGQVASDCRVVALLTQARALVADETHWVQGRYATTDHRYCAIGAVRAAARGTFGWYTSRETQRLLHREAGCAGYPTMESLNDHSTHRQVLATFDAAISIASKRVH